MHVAAAVPEPEPSVVRHLGATLEESLRKRILLP
jgi:hypothetical protein